MAQRLDQLIDELLEHRHEPMIIGGFWAQYWMIVERARARGIGEGEFHPETVITGGGGTKGANLPDDYEAQILGFFGLTRGQRAARLRHVGAVGRSADGRRTATGRCRG